MFNEMLCLVIKGILKTYDFKNNKVIFIRRSYKNNKDLKYTLQNYNYEKYDIYFIDDKYFEKNDYAIVIDKRYFKV